MKVLRPAALLVLVLVAVMTGRAAADAAQPTEADVFVAEGILALDDKQYTEALAAFRRALESEPDHVEALYYSGVAYMALGQPADAVAFLERARQRAPAETSIAFQLGLAYFAQNFYDRAQPLLEDVFAREPALDSLGYYVGFLRYRREDYQGALRAFRAGRTTDASIAQLNRFYAGLALAALGLPGQAAAEVEQALRLQPASPLTGPAERLRDALAASRSPERQFHLNVRVGVFFDDNVRTRPEAKPSDPLVSELRQPKHESTGELASLRLDYDWLHQGPWDGTVSYSFFTTYNNEMPSFNIVDNLATASVSHRGTLAEMPLQVGAQYAFDALLLDEQLFLQRHAVSLFGTLVESSRHLTNVLAKVDVKDYREPRGLPVAEVQDAVNWMVGVLHFVRFAEDRHYVKAGYQFDVDDARGRNFAYEGHRFMVGGLYTLPWRGVRVSYDFLLHYRDYLHDHTLLPTDAPGTVARSDQEYSHLLHAEMPFGRGLTLGVDYQVTLNRSNLAAFAYTRDTVTLSVSWQY